MHYFIEMIIDKLLNICHLNYTAFAVSGNFGISLTGLTTPVGWLSLLQVTVLSPDRCVIKHVSGVVCMESRCAMKIAFCLLLLW